MDNLSDLERLLDEEGAVIPVEAVAQFFTALATTIRAMDHVEDPKDRNSKEFLAALDYWTWNPNPESEETVKRNALFLRVLRGMLNIGLDEVEIGPEQT